MTLQQISELNNLVTSVHDGYVNALKTYIDLHFFKQHIEAAIAQIKDQAIDEALNYPEKSFQLSGGLAKAEITKRADAGRWDYSHIPQWSQTKDDLSKIEQAAQAANKTGHRSVDENGEEIPAASYKPGKENIAIKQLGLL